VWENLVFWISATYFFDDLILHQCRMNPTQFLDGFALTQI